MGFGYKNAVRGRDWQQEMYCTASKEAVRRARFLRSCGFSAKCISLGVQVTDVGLLKTTMVDIRMIPSDHEVPEGFGDDYNPSDENDHVLFGN